MTALFNILRGADQFLFHKINHDWTHPALDFFFPFLTDLDKNRVLVWGALPVFLCWWLNSQRGRAAKVFLAVVLAVGISDAVAHRFIKPYFHRARPQKAGISEVLRTREHGGYSFPSNHAANTCAGAAVLAAAYPGLKWLALALAFLVAYSRVYVGVHFPGDVLAGACLGLTIGGMVAAAFLRWGLRKTTSRARKP